MFTGIIEERGSVKAIRRGAVSSYIEINAETVLTDSHIGDSIAVNGVCLTVADLTSGYFRADIMNETLNRSALGDLTKGSQVNLERAMSANGRFGGHIVSGHIDGIGIITDIKKDGIAVWYTIVADSGVLRYIVEKGSVAIDGISLTVASVSDKDFKVSVIPHTAEQTILGSKKAGDKVNLENDIIGKYIERFMGCGSRKMPGSRITMDFLAKNGF